MPYFSVIYPPTVSVSTSNLHHIFSHLLINTGDLNNTKMLFYSMLFFSYRVTQYASFCLASKGWGICRVRLGKTEKISLASLTIFISLSNLYGNLASVSTVFFSLALLIVFFQFITDNVSRTISDFSTYISDLSFNQERLWRISDRQSVLSIISESLAIERLTSAPFSCDRFDGVHRRYPQSTPGCTKFPQKNLAETNTLEHEDPEQRYLNICKHNLSILRKLWYLFVAFSGFAFIVSLIFYSSFKC